MEPMRLLVTDPAAQALRQATAWLIMTLGIKNMSEPWYSVKCLFFHPTRAREGEDYLYEERITLWRASTFEEAHALALKQASN